MTKEDIQNHFKDANGTIAEVKLMNGFGFIEYEDAMDARDVVPGKSLRPKCAHTSSCTDYFLVGQPTVSQLSALGRRLRSGC